MEMKTLRHLGLDESTVSEQLSDISSLYIPNGFFNINPDSGVVDRDFIFNIKYILAILLSKVGNDISRINENSITINIEKERLSRNLSLYDVLKFMEKKFLTKNGINLEIFDRYESAIPLRENGDIYVAGSVDIPELLEPNINILFNEILEKNTDHQLSHYFGYEPTGRYHLKMKGYERLYNRHGGKSKQRKSKKRKRQTRKLL